MICELLDVNVWLALEVKTHALHSSAVRWFPERTGSNCAFCRVTQMAFLRLLTNKSVMGVDVQTPQQAWQAYRTILDSSEVIWLAEPVGLETQWEQLCTRMEASGGWWTDAYLAAFAIGHGLKLVTFDKDFRRFEADGLQLELLNPLTSSAP